MVILWYVRVYYDILEYMVSGILWYILVIVHDFRVDDNKV